MPTRNPRVGGTVYDLPTLFNREDPDTTWKVNLNVPLAACLPVFYRTWDSQLQALADKLPVAHSGLLTFVE